MGEARRWTLDGAIPEPQVRPGGSRVEPMESVPVVAVEDVLLREDVRAVLDAERERLLARAASVLPHDDMGASAISGALLSVSRVRDALGLGDDPSTRGEQGGE